jgi:undecaprenyl diphosphate synthase
MRSSKLNLVIAINYSGQWDIVQAIEKSNESSEAFETHLCTAPFTPVDLLVRTGGECRISNFLLWPIAYAEIHFSDRLWPDFTNKEWRRVLNRFQDTDRRFGRLSTR